MNKQQSRQLINSGFVGLIVFLSLGTSLMLTSGCDVWEALCVMSGDDNSDFDFDQIGDEIEDEFDDEF